jgi:DNA invertase Pin-like site-specific DNA recombinase
MKVFGYCRVSSTGQIEGNGFDRQIAAIETWAKKGKHQIAAVYRESVSGTKDQDDRPAFKQMVSDILRNGVRVVVVESLDRLAREYRIQEQLLIYLASKGITLIACNTGEDITAAIMGDPMRKAMVQIQGIFAELDKSMLVKKLATAREKVKTETGKCGGRHRYDETDEGQEILAVIRKLRRKGRNKRVPSWQEVCDQLNAMGYRNKSGGEFKPASIRVMVSRSKSRAYQSKRAKAKQ